MTTATKTRRAHAERTPAPADAPHDADTPLESLADERLLALHQQHGDQRPYLATLINRYERELYSFLRRYLGDATLAEDAFQATFLQVHRKGHLCDSSRRFRPWLYTVATNRAIDLQRRNKRHQAVSLDRANRSEN